MVLFLVIANIECGWARTDPCAGSRHVLLEFIVEKFEFARKDRVALLLAPPLLLIEALFAC